MDTCRRVQLTDAAAIPGDAQNGLRRGVHRSAGLERIESMFILSLGAVLVVISFAAVHTVCAAFALRWRAHRSLDPNFRPSAAVILAVRGCDPSLRQTLVQLINQDYDPLQIHIVVDHSTDPAWAAVRDAIKDHDSRGRCRIQSLEEQPRNGGLKSASIAQAVRSLCAVEVVATIDADVAPHTTWLRELIAPLADVSVGVSTGNHWFEPKAANCGSLVRSLWNAGALIPTSFFANPWGGSCAMRSADIRQSGLLEAWRNSVVDDGPVRHACARLKRRIVFLPTLVMLNREDCSLGYCLRYLARILTWSRIYETAYRWTVAHLLVNLAPLLFAIGLLPLAIARGDWISGLVLIAGLAGHATLLWLAYLLVRTAVDRMAKLRGERLPRLGWLRLLRLLVLTPLAFGVYALAVIRALRSRYICWRGVWYYVIHGSHVILLTYQPYSDSNSGASPKTSI